jgi:hypothetical protein
MKGAVMVPIMSQINPVHVLISCFLKIQFPPIYAYASQLVFSIPITNGNVPDKAECCKDVWWNGSKDPLILRH